MAAEPKAANPRWKEIVDRYQQPAVRRALWQVANTLVPYAALWYLMHLSLAVSYWLTAALAVLAGAFWCACSSFSMTAGTGRSFLHEKPTTLWA